MNLSAEGAEPEANARNAFATGERRTPRSLFPSIGDSRPDF